MVTADEIAGVSIFADLGPVERERLVPGRSGHPARSRRVRGPRGRRARAVRGARGPPGDGRGRRRESSASSAAGASGELIGEVPIALGTTFPFGFRAAEPSRVMRVEAQDYHAIAASAPGGRGEARRRWRGSGSSGLQGITRRPAAAACNRGRASLGRGVRGAAALSRPQPGHVQLDHARCAGCGRSVGRPPAGGRGLSRDPGRRREDRGAPAAAPGRRAARARHAAGGRRVRHGDRGRGARGAGGARSTEPRRGCGQSWSSGRRPAARLARRRESRTTSDFPVGRVRRRAGEPRAAAGRPTRRRDPRHPVDSRGSTPRHARCTSTAATS